MTISHSLLNCLLFVGKPAQHWNSTRGLPALTRLNNFRIRLLVGCNGLEADASRFRCRHLPTIPQSSAICRICKSGSEDPAHFIAHCCGLSSVRELLQLNAPPRYNLIDLLHSDAEAFCNIIILGIEWIDNSDLPTYALHVRKFWPLLNFITPPSLQGLLSIKWRRS